MKLHDETDAERCAEFCPMLYEFRSIPPVLGHVRFIFPNTLEPDRFVLPAYVCYNETLCADFLPATKRIDNLTCRHFNDLGLKNTDSYLDIVTLVKYVKDRFRGCLIGTNETQYCNSSAMYRCENSTKCISKQRLLDGIPDCPFDDDETFNQSCSLIDIRQRFKCFDDGNEKCFASLVIQDEQKNCGNGKDESYEQQNFIQTHISFQTICDGKTELSPILIDGRNETDETECQHWPCNNTYSRCDDVWSCENGADEVNCPPSTCSEHHHSCVFPNDTSYVSCLPIGLAGNGFDDCLGATDERNHSVKSYPGGYVEHYFHCWNDSTYIDINKLCNNETDCPSNDDELFCKSFESSGLQYCADSDRTLTNVELFLCSHGYISRSPIIFFKLHNMKSYPLRLMTANTSSTLSTGTQPRSIEEKPTFDISSDYAWWCNRGIPIRIRMRMSGNTSRLYCLCPPSYYGDRCQYQNQRVSLTLQIQVTSDWRNVFIFLITLIDNERNIESHDHIQYLPIRDCRNKFNVYLLYSTRPKNTSKNYSIQIDAFHQLTWNYRASWIFPLRFPFLPVHRLPVLLKVAYSNVKLTNRCWPPCIHGQCLYYINNHNWTFCRCEPSWSGVQCNIKYACDCASDSLCISNSICLCPPGRFGPRCHLLQSSCHPTSCINGGQCIPVDVRYTSAHGIKSMCICPEGYIGDRCEQRQRQTRIDISFHPELNIPSSLLVHLIAVQKNIQHNRTSIMKKIGFDQSLLTFYTSVWFNIAFAQMFNRYYLIIVQEQTITLAYISTQIIPSRQCQSISEIFNQTFAKQHLLKRIKYYHRPCQQQLELACFYDDVHFCLCTLNRQANCFEFDHNMTYNCGGENLCENQGHCFQDDSSCPTPPICACRQCYFGSKCQFSTEGATLSLDTILGYHIRMKTGIRQQPTIVKVAIALTTIMFTLGFISSYLSFQTFRGEEIRNVGCGLYLFASSIISMITITILTLKFSFLLASQIGSINNRSFLYIQCVSIDFLLRFLLNASGWLSACVAIERAVNVAKVNFDKAKSKQVAKWVILIVLLFTSCTYIYDPIYRRLMDDEEEQRTWCVSQYSSFIQSLDWALNIFHFSTSFAINCISAPFVIITAARTRSNSQKTKSFKEHLREQLYHHKHLLISSAILIVLALPRLIISFLSGCMKSARDSWLYLIGYFISFTPPMLTFVVFVLPSEMYKKEFNQTIKRLWQRKTITRV